MTDMKSDGVAAPATMPPTGRGRRHWAAALQQNAVYAALSRVVLAHPRVAAMLVVGIPVLWVVVWNVLPLIGMLRISFLDEYPARITQGPGVTIEHYLSLFTELAAYRPFLRTMGFALAVVLVNFIVALPIAYFLAKRVPRNWQIRLLILVTVPSWVSEVIRAFSQILLLASNGAINITLQWSGDLRSRSVSVQLVRRRRRHHLRHRALHAGAAL